MRRLTAAVIVVAMVAGCSNYRQSRTTAIVGGVIVGVGLVVSAGGLSADSSDTSEADISDGAIVAVAGGAVALVGAAVLAAGLIGMAAYPKVPEPEPAPTILTVRERVELLTKQATRAARSGGCGTVFDRDREVHDLDPEFHATVFVRDVDFKQCLEEGEPGLFGE